MTGPWGEWFFGGLGSSAASPQQLGSRGLTTRSSRLDPGQPRTPGRTFVCGHGGFNLPGAATRIDSSSRPGSDGRGSASAVPREFLVAALRGANRSPCDGHHSHGSSVASTNTQSAYEHRHDRCAASVGGAPGHCLGSRGNRSVDTHGGGDIRTVGDNSRAVEDNRSLSGPYRN